MRVIYGVVVILGALVLIAWLGLQVRPRPFAAAPVTPGPIEMVPVPAGLPAPVDRFIRATYGDEIPLIKSAVLTGRARIRPNLPFYLPARFRFVHEAGTNYRHYIEATWFGFPILRVNEGIVDGASFFENPLLGNETDEPGTNQAATLALWAEAVWFPALLATDSRVAWEPVDDMTALLRVPFEDQTETFVVRFDPESAMLTVMEAMRARTRDITQKTLWLTRSERWGKVGGYDLGIEASATWFDQGSPWAYFTVEDLDYNADVSEYVRARGK